MFREDPLVAVLFSAGLVVVIVSVLNFMSKLASIY